MSNCLNNLVGLSTCDVPTTAMRDLMNAPEITDKSLAKTANSKYITGQNLAKKMIDLAQSEVVDNLIAQLRQQNFVTDLTQPSFDTATFAANTILPPMGSDMNTDRKGQILHGVNKRRSLKTITITKVELYPVDDNPTGQIHVVDDGVRYTYNVNLVGGSVNSFDINRQATSKNISILIYAPGTRFYSSKLVCHEGCHGQLPNECAYARSYDGQNESRSKEGYGMNVTFECACDFSALFCDFAKSHVAPLVYNKTRMLLLQERIYSDRLNDFIVFSVDEAKELYGLLNAEYTDTFNSLIASMPVYLKGYNDDCITCQNAQWVPNG